MLKEIMESYDITGKNDVPVDAEKLKWLIEQAERAQQLEQAIELKIVTVQMKNYVYSGPDDSVSHKLIKRNSKLRDALEFYADEKNHAYDLDWLDNVLESEAMKDKGNKARQALE